MKKVFALLLAGMILLFSGCVSVSIKENDADALAVTASQTQTTETTVATTAPEENKPMIAITFDDGPSANTKKMLDIFKKYNSKATFFVVGNRIEGNEDVLNRIVDEGHDLGSHTWDHIQLTDLKKKEIDKQLKRTKKKIYNVTGCKSNLLRPPYGSVNDKVKAVAKSNDISIINWNVDTEDWKSKNKKKISKVIMNEARDGCIILCHDLYDSTVEAMEIAIPKLIKQGYQLVTVTELLESHDGTIVSGEVYFNRWETAD